MSTVSLLDYYKIKCADEKWYKLYYQNGEKDNGTVFKFLGTNYRDLTYFEYYFRQFYKYIDVPRNEWDVKETTGQEVAKQYTRNLVVTELYISRRNEDRQLYYQLTKKGEIFGRMLKENFTDNEKRILILFMILNGSFLDKPRYILKEARDVLERLEEYSVDIDKYISDTKLFLKNMPLKGGGVDKLFSYNTVWLNTFNKDEDFITMFNLASEEERNKLKSFTINSYKEKDKSNVLSYKYKSTNNQRGTTWDNMLMIYLVHYIDKYVDNFDYLDFFDFILDKYNEIREVNKEKIINFIENNKSVFRVIYKSITSASDDYTEIYVPEYVPRQPQLLELNEEKIDTTSEEGVFKLTAVRGVLKNLAKQQSEYKCALEPLNMCKYFTSKEEEKNYLEIHHFIPREFSYEFEDTIEVIENYVPLCPRCHSMIHRAADRERIGLINYLFNQKNELLEEKNLKADIDTVYKFYSIDEFTQKH